MSMIGHTPGGSSIFSPSGPKKSNRKGKVFYTCRDDPLHKLTPNQAKSSGYTCTHCGADLKVKATKIAELTAMAQSLGFDIVRKGNTN